MTAKSGFIGFLTGLLASIILFCPLAIDLPAGSTRLPWTAIVATAIITVGGGAMAVLWSKSVQPLRCIALGALAGGLTGIVFFCLLGAATAGVIANTESPAVIVAITNKIFLIYFPGGIGLGALGGWMASPRRKDQTDVFDKSEPQMAMNAAITALPASIIAAALSAAVFSRLAGSVGDQMVLNAPLISSLLLVLISHFALMLVVPHETKQAESRCGMDEVKMAAFVSISAAPVLALLLIPIGSKILLNPRVIIALSISAVMSLKSLRDLFKSVLPARDSFSLPPDDQEKAEAKFFGTIADSPASRLIVLCTGCGAVMILPLYVTVFSTLINLSNLPRDSVESARKLFQMQALTSAGLVASSAAGLIFIYMIYLNLGRWYKKRRLRQLEK